FQNDYWPKTVQRLIGDVADDYEHLGNDEKAVIIRDRLDSIYTSDHFLVLVYNPCSLKGHVSVDFYVHQFRRGGCNIVVYRRTSYNQGNCTFPEENYRNHCRTKRRRADTLLPAVENVERSIPGVGLVALIKKEHNVAIRMKGIPAWSMNVSCQSHVMHNMLEWNRDTGDALLIVGCT
ncbi:hypothetical protein PFISCL1PPCAC_4281, partial [Pristionchus fissidentatus]